MKKYVFAVFLSFSFGLMAQESKIAISKNQLKVAPFRMIAHNFAIGYERILTPSTNLYLLSQIIYSEESYSYEKGYVQDVGLKVHFVKGKEVMGFSNCLYFMPYVQYGTFDFQNAYKEINKPLNVRSKAKFQSYAGGLLLGWKLILKKRFYSDIYFGGGVRTNSLRPEEQGKLHGINSFWDRKGVVPKGGVEFGFMF